MNILRSAPKGLVRLRRLLGHLRHQPGNVGPLHVMHLFAVQEQDAIAVDHALVAFLRHE